MGFNSRQLLSPKVLPHVSRLTEVTAFSLFPFPLLGSSAAPLLAAFDGTL